MLSVVLSSYVPVTSSVRLPSTPHYHVRQIHGGLGAYAGAIEARLRSNPSTRVRTSCPVTRIIYNNASRKYVIESREAVQQKGEPMYGGTGSGAVPMHAYGGGTGQPQVGCRYCR